MTPSSSGLGAGLAALLLAGGMAPADAQPATGYRGGPTGPRMAAPGPHRGYASGPGRAFAPAYARPAFAPRATPQAYGVGRPAVRAAVVPSYGPRIVDVARGNWRHSAGYGRREARAWGGQWGAPQAAPAPRYGRDYAAPGYGTLVYGSAGYGGQNYGGQGYGSPGYATGGYAEPSLGLHYGEAQVASSYAQAPVYNQPGPRIVYGTGYAAPPSNVRVIYGSQPQWYCPPGAY